MKDIAPDVERWQSRGDAHVAVATVVSTRGSAPRPLGSRLAVSERTELAGSVSGGCVESDVAEQAGEVLGSGEPRLVTYGITDDLAWSVGLPCGGEIDVFLERLDLGAESAPSSTAALIEAAGNEHAAVVFTVVAGAGTGTRVIWSDRPEVADLESLGLGREDASELLRGGRNRLLEVESRKILAEVFGPPPKLLIYGAVDTAEALCALARPLGWRTIVADARAAFLTSDRIPSADERIVGWPDEVLEQVQPDYTTAIVVLTHDDKFDVPLLQAALTTDALYIGALGSRRNQARRRERLIEEGVDEEALARIHGPAGLDLGAGSPPETALAILAEIVAVRAGRSGGSLRGTTGRIHVEAASELMS